MKESEGIARKQVGIQVTSVTWTGSPESFKEVIGHVNVLRG